MEDGRESGHLKLGMDDVESSGVICMFEWMLKTCCSIAIDCMFNQDSDLVAAWPLASVIDNRSVDGADMSIFIRR